MVKSALLALCGLTILAVVYLTTSVVVLRPPRANLAAWLPFATLLVAQCILTFVAASRSLAWLRWLAAVGGAGLVAVGVWMVRGTLSSDHFEGYALGTWRDARPPGRADGSRLLPDSRPHARYELISRQRFRPRHLTYSIMSVSSARTAPAPVSPALDPTVRRQWTLEAVS